jgi:hypothetical protein
MRKPTRQQIETGAFVACAATGVVAAAYLVLTHKQNVIRTEAYVKFLHDSLKSSDIALSKTVEAIATAIQK